VAVWGRLLKSLVGLCQCRSFECNLALWLLALRCWCCARLVRAEWCSALRTL